jgi:hypothetical protein
MIQLSRSFDKQNIRHLFQLSDTSGYVHPCVAGLASVHAQMHSRKILAVASSRHLIKRDVITMRPQTYYIRAHRLTGRFLTVSLRFFCHCSHFGQVHHQIAERF